MRNNFKQPGNGKHYIMQISIHVFQSLKFLYCVPVALYGNGADSHHNRLWDIHNLSSAAWKLKAEILVRIESWASLPVFLI